MATMTSTMIAQRRQELEQMIRQEESAERERRREAYRDAEKRLQDAYARRQELQAAFKQGDLGQREQELYARASKLIDAYDQRERYQPPPFRTTESCEPIWTPQEARAHAEGLKKYEQRSAAMLAEARQAFKEYAAAAEARIAAENAFKNHEVHATVARLEKERDAALAALKS
jgi:hypothetical protein